MIVGVVDLLRHQLEGLDAQVLAYRNWVSPEAGWSLVTVTTPTSWASGPTSARYPSLQVEILTRPSPEQSDAEQLSEPIASAVIRALHWTDGKYRKLSDGSRVLGSQLSGETGPTPAEGHESDGWTWRRATFDVLLL